MGDVSIRGNFVGRTGAMHIEMTKGRIIIIIIIMLICSIFKEAEDVVWNDSDLLCDSPNIVPPEDGGASYQNDDRLSVPMFNFSLITDPTDPLFEDVIKESEFPEIYFTSSTWIVTILPVFCDLFTGMSFIFDNKKVLLLETARGVPPAA